MKTNQILPLFMIIFLFYQVSICSDIGKIWPSEKKTWVDPEFGYEITQWTNHSAESWHLYFNIESFIDKDHAVIFSKRNGDLNLFNLNLQSGEMIQMTNEKNMSTSVWHYPGLKTLWYINGNQIKALNTETYKVTNTITTDMKPGSMTVTCDGKWIVTAVDKTKPAEQGPQISKGPYAIYKISTETGEMIQISPDYGFVIGHLQANPVDPALVSYCWQHLYRPGSYPGTIGATPLRIWWINIDGTDGGPVGPQEFGIHRTHEFWFPDGSRIGYSARYIYGPNQGRQFMGSCAPDGSDNYMMELPVKFAHSQMFKDNRHWVVDIFDGMVLTLLTIDERKAVKIQPLFRHDSSWEGQSSHPHPHFSPDGKIIIFSTDKYGSANVFSVKIK
ncbi:PD40 domain-containing protein [candidate division KSB1 bacterium]|nr:PD40 domain-containing protein [candidate division KSB1 bacterium]